MSSGGVGGPAHLTANIRVFMGNREITDIVRVEAQAVVDAHDNRQKLDARSWQ